MSFPCVKDQIEMFAEPITATIESIEKNQAVWVHCLGSSWNTKFHTNTTSEIRPGQLVTVVGRCGTKLLIVSEFMNARV